MGCGQWRFQRIELDVRIFMLRIAIVGTTGIEIIYRCEAVVATVTLFTFFE